MDFERVGKIEMRGMGDGMFYGVFRRRKSKLPNFISFAVSFGEK